MPLYQRPPAHQCSHTTPLSSSATLHPSRAKATDTDLVRRGWRKSSYLQEVLSARVYDVCKETELQDAPILSTRIENEVLLKREDTQPVFSFKLRGAYNKIASLPESALANGIVACSAGNHAQGVAYSAVKLGIDAKIIMPTATPAIKVDAVRKLGGNVVLHGSTFDEAQDESNRLVEVEGRTLVHPFDDPLVIAGQGTIGMEILKQRTGRPLDAIFVCCGGGGMLAGIAAYVKSVRPEVKVIGVEAEDAAGMTRSLQEDRVVTLDQVRWTRWALLVVWRVGEWGWGDMNVLSAFPCAMRAQT